MNEIIEMESDQESAPTPASSLTPTALISKALESGTSLENLQALLDMQFQWEANEARKQFVTARSRFQSICPVIEKDRKVGYDSKKGGKVGYDHSSLAQTVKTIQQPLSECGLSYSWKTETTDSNAISVTCIVTHKAGHSESTSLSGKPDLTGNKNSIQATASTITYLQRYTLFAILGLASAHEDDDGQGGAPAQKNQPAQQPSRPEKDSNSKPAAAQQPSKQEKDALAKPRAALVKIMKEKNVHGFARYLSSARISKADKEDIYNSLSENGKKFYQRLLQPANNAVGYYSNQIEDCLVNNDELGFFELHNQIKGDKEFVTKVMQSLSSNAITEMAITMEKHSNG